MPSSGGHSKAKRRPCLDSDSLIRRRRVPKRQKTVKIELLDRPNRAPVLKMLGHGTQTEGFQHDDHRRMQKRQVAEAVAQPEIAHRRVGIDVLLLDKPCQSGAFVSEFIDKLE